MIAMSSDNILAKESESLTENTGTSKKEDLDIDLTTSSKEAPEAIDNDLKRNHGDQTDGKDQKKAVKNCEIIASDPEKVNNVSVADSSDDNTIEHIGPNSNREYIKLEEVKDLDILLPKDGTSLGKEKGDFYGGLVSYRKLIDRIRPIFMQRNDHEHKLNIGDWLLGKVNEKGGKFLKAVDGNTDICEVMDTKDALEFTIQTFEANEPWTTTASDHEGDKNEVVLYPMSAKNTSPDEKVEPIVQEHDTKVLTAPSAEQESLATGGNNSSENSEPPLKKTKAISIDSTPCLPPPSSDMERKIMEKVFGGFSRERQIIQGELTENKEILLMRQERLSRLEVDFRLFQERQIMPFPSEQWLAEKIIRQEEIFENRELLQIQFQRCRRLQTLLELNERHMFEQKMTIARGFGVEKRKQQLAVQQMVDQHYVLEAELNRRSIVAEQNNALEQEIKYRQEMEHAMNRQMETKQAMAARQHMIREASNSPKVIPSKHPSENSVEQISSSNDAIQEPNPDIIESADRKVDTVGEKALDSRPKTLWMVRRSDECDVEEDDDDFIII